MHMQGMPSPTGVNNSRLKAQSSQGFFGNIITKLRRNKSTEFRDGISRRGRRNDEDISLNGKSRDSSTHSAVFDLELSHRGVSREGSVRNREGSFRLFGRSRSQQQHQEDISQSQSAVMTRLSYLGQPMVDFERDLLQDTKSLAEQCRSRHTDGRLDVGHLAEELGHLGYAVKVVTVDGHRATEADTTLPASGTISPLVSKQQQNHVHFDPASILEKLRHEYLLCTGKSDGSLRHDGCVIDPRFKEQFVIGHPTAAYEMMLTAVPVEFVGTRLRLDALVRAVGHEIAVVYSSQGLPLPPWRKEQALLSRWAAPVGSIMGGGGGINLARDSSSSNTNNNNTYTATDGGGGAVGAWSSTLRTEASGGSAQFYSFLELHLKSMQLSSGFQGEGSSPDKQLKTQPISSNSSKNKGGGGKSQQQAADEKSNKPKRRLNNSNSSITTSSTGGGLSSLGSKDSGDGNSNGGAVKPSSSGLNLVSEQEGEEEEGEIEEQQQQQQQPKKVVSLLAKGIKSIDTIWSPN